MKKVAIVKAEDVTKEVIEQWKKEHGDVFMVTVDDKVGYIKKPDRKTLGAAMAFGKTNPLKFNETILNNCWLGGDEEIKDDDGCFMAVGAQLDKIIELKEAEIKKL